MEKRRVGIGLLTCNKLEWTKKCLEALQENTNPTTYKLRILDNGSTDGTVEYLKTTRFNCTYKKENIGIPAAMNEIWKEQMSDPDIEYLVRMHNDIMVTKGWLYKMIDIMDSDKKIARVGLAALQAESLVRLPISDINEMCIQFAEKKRARANLDPSIIRVSVVKEVGLLDEKFGLHECEDCDHNKRMEDAGYEVLGANDAVVGHAEALTRHKMEGAGAVMAAARKYWTEKYPGVNMQRWNRSVYSDIKIGNIEFKLKGV